MLHQHPTVLVDDAGARLFKSAGMVWQASNAALRVRYPGLVQSAAAYAAIGLLLALIAWVFTNPGRVSARRWQ